MTAMPPMPPVPMAQPGIAPDAPVSDASMMDLADAVGQQQSELMAQTAPAPNKPYKRKTLEYLRDTLAAFAEQFPGAPAVAWEFVEREGPGGKDGWPEPLPAELFLPLLAITDAIKTLNTDGRFDEYIVDPMDLLDDSALRVAADTIATAMKDPALMEALAGGPEPAAEEPVAEMEEEGAEEPVPADEFGKYLR